MIALRIQRKKEKTSARLFFLFFYVNWIFYLTSSSILQYLFVESRGLSGLLTHFLIYECSVVLQSLVEFQLLILAEKLNSLQTVWNVNCTITAIALSITFNVFCLDGTLLNFLVEAIFPPKSPVCSAHCVIHSWLHYEVTANILSPWKRIMKL